MKRAQCKSCHAPILFTDTATGSTMPLDPTPTVEGNIEIDGMGRAVVRKKQADGLRRYTSHFATCPDAARHRKARR